MLKAILEENYDENYLCTDKAQVLSKSISFPRFYFVTKVAIRGYNTVNLSLLQFYYNLQNKQNYIHGLYRKKLLGHIIYVIHKRPILQIYNLQKKI